MKKKLLTLLTFALLAITAMPINALADEITVNANISQNTSIPDVIKAEPIETVQDVLKGVCEDRGYGDPCAKHLLGMLWKESNNKANAVGDRGLALGYFQIHYKLHKVSVACATDLVCSANWTLDYMEQHSYPKYPTYAIQCHNGCNIDNGYATSAIRHGNRLWDQPLTVTPSIAVMANTQLAKN